MHAYRVKKPQFAFSFHGELSHDSINLVGVADDDITEWLKYLKYSGLLKRTILVMMADHGNRYVKHQNLFTFQFRQNYLLILSTTDLPMYETLYRENWKSDYHFSVSHFPMHLRKDTTKSTLNLERI